jgi:sugar-phosphatase
LNKQFDSAVSAEHMKYGKPHPEVFIQCAEKLSVLPNQCLVIEDSVNGVIAGKAALMKVVAVPDMEHYGNEKFAIADHKLTDMKEVLALFKTLFA